MGRDEESFAFDYEGLAACIGVSPAIISRLAHAKDKNYRTFEVDKRGGGTRVIETPRIFLKVVQWFILDFVIYALPIHRSAHAFMRGRSIATNAHSHLKQRFVGNLDIKDFFGSIRESQVERLLLRNGYRGAEAKLIAMLCCKESRLPQGAPTSPAISNALLLEFDEAMCLHAYRSELRYTRYADDITFSGSSRASVEDAFKYAQLSLERGLGLVLNRDKTRIASCATQQRVTGLVVNEKGIPPKAMRRKVRAAFERTSREKSPSAKEIERLAGYLAYLTSFPALRSSLVLAKCRQQLAAMTRRARKPTEARRLA